MKIDFKAIRMAFDYVSFGREFEHQAYLDKESGKIYWHSEYGDNEEELPDDLSLDKYVSIPHKNDLDLGRCLVFRFAADHMPGDYDTIRSFFNHRGAYSRLNDFLQDKAMRDEWREYEERASDAALLEWCESEGIEVAVQRKAVSKRMKLLTIGNSFSGNATEHMLRLMGGNESVKIKIGRADLGGCSLEKHWNLVEQCDFLPDVKPYEFHFLGGETTPMSLREILTSNDWNYVTLQQVSHQSWRPETYVPYIDKLHALVKELAPQARVLLHQTWAYRVDDDDYFSENGINQREMRDRIKNAYDELSKRLDCPILPSGAAIAKARAELQFERDSKYDFDNPKPLELPNQKRSLSVGHFWRTGNTPSGKAELAFDPRHLNHKGAYIANAVWYEMLTGSKIADNSYQPERVSKKELELFKQVAHETVAEYGGPLN